MRDTQKTLLKCYRCMGTSLGNSHNLAGQTSAWYI